MRLSQRLGAECIGSAVLLAGIVGSGVMAERLAAGNAALALLANAAATASLLYVLITTLAPVSGAHFNPAVTAAVWLRGGLEGRVAVAYVAMQFAGAICGVLLAHAMFGLDLVTLAGKARSGAGQWLSEAVATAGLVVTVLLGDLHRRAALPALVASYIFAAYWFTASTSFANPAVTVARALTDTFTGIRPGDVPLFVLCQMAGVGLALVVVALIGADKRHAEAE
jgi:glycerol uptake facilitator-like aquaporin